MQKLFLLIPGLQKSTSYPYLKTDESFLGSTIWFFNSRFNTHPFHVLIHCHFKINFDITISAKSSFFEFFDYYFIRIYLFVMYSTWSIQLIYVYLFTMIISWEDNKEHHSSRFCYSLCLNTKCLLSTLFTNDPINVVYYSGKPISTPISLSSC